MQKITAEYLAEQGLSANFPSYFFERVEITGSCWFWTGSHRKKGVAYGNVYRGLGRSGNSGTILAHRASWLLHFGPVPNGLQVCHDCPDGDCPYCVNPGHLWLGTITENLQDMARKGRHWSPVGRYTGQKSANAAFTDAQADKIRTEYKPRRVTLDFLATRYQVSKQVIYRIVHAKTYNNTGAADVGSFKHK